MQQSFNAPQQTQHFSHFSRKQSDKLKYQPQLDQLKSFLKDNRISQIKQKSRISTSKQLTTLQKIQVEPELRIDELKEHKWQILSQNCQYLLELSRQILDKPNYEQLYRSSSNPRLNGLILENDEDIKLSNNSKQNVNNSQLNPIQIKLAQIQNSKKRSKNKSFINNNLNFVKVEKPSLKKHQSLHVSPTCSSFHISQTSKPTTKLYFAKLNQVSSSAYNLQLSLKKQQFDEIKSTNQKVFCIRSDFDKFSKILNESEQD
ncbi:unnamed protein product [Paramecium sonneborni]|uniref:Uncharacterized protein n=1 Tax=Paramecium sonneborni TaxID=65129 RepID=A0A8S1QMP2_9CILI|nr:unnamed protein product [Paramecium sonneborni]